MDKVTTVRDAMIDVTYSLPPEMPAHEAIDFVTSKKLAGIPVIDAEGALVGFLTEKDCLRHVANSHQYNQTGAKVRDIMSDFKQALHPDMDLLSAAMHFLSCHFATLPVIADNKLVGSLSRQNMLLAIQRMFRERGIAMKNGKAAIAMMDHPSGIGALQGLAANANREQLASVLGGRMSRD